MSVTPAADTDALRGRLVAQALDEGFVSCRICRPDAVPDVPERLQAFVDAGYHGQMAWMADRMAWRGNPAALWPEARSVIMLAESYTPEYDPTEVLNHPDKAGVSVYAQGRDYHDIVKKRLKRVARWLVAQEPCEVKVFVDTAPVPEKALGQAAGLGWQGKHTNLLSRLGELGLSGCDFHHIGFHPRHGRGGSLRVVPVLPRGVPDQCLPRALSAGCAALHFLSDD